MRVAFPSIASKTGFKSPGDELITCKTSAVAVCPVQRLAEIGGALTQFVQQLRVLDGDDHLAAKVFESRNLAYR